MKRIFKGASVLLPDFSETAGDIIVEDGRIASIGEGDSPRTGKCEEVDCAGLLAIPGLVNCHCHAPMTLLRGVGGGLPLKRWLEEAIFPIEARLAPEDVAAGMAWGAAEMLASGTTCVADMYDFPEEGASALEASGMKGNLCRVGLSFSETEEIPPHRLEECVAFVADGRAGSRIARDICVHSEYLTNEKFCRALAEANRDMRRPVHVHVSETRKEHEECIARHGMTPTAYLASTGLFDFGGYAAHCVYCTDDDFRIMRERGVTLVHNPTSNMKLASGFARVLAAVKLGVNVALGTDGPASNDNLDMFDEMHLASLVHKGLSEDPTVLPPPEIVAMATSNGAKALGRKDAGALAPGMAADIAFVDMSAPHLKPCVSAANLVVHSMHGADVAMTVVDGEIVYDARGGKPWEKRFPKFDFAAAKARFVESLARIS